MYKIGQFSKCFLSTIAVCGAFLPDGFALTQLGNGELFIEGRGDIVYDSNIFIQEGQKFDDFSAEVYAGLGFIQEDRSLLNARAELGRKFTRFFDFTDQNSEDWQSEFSLSWPNNIESDTFAELNGGWNQQSYANAALGRRIQVEDLDLRGTYRYRFSEKFSSLFAASYLDQEYKDIANIVDDPFLGRQSETMNFAITPSYRYSEKLSGRLLLRHREVSYKERNSNDKEGQTVALGATGQLLPKVDGSIFFGFQHSKFKQPVNGQSSANDPFYSIDLVWNPRDKTSVNLSGSSDFRSSANGQINDRKDLHVIVEESLSQRSIISGGVLISNNDYQGRTNRQDDSVIYQANYNFRINEATFMNSRISYEDRSSDDNRFTYTQMLLSVGVSRIW